MKPFDLAAALKGAPVVTTKGVRVSSLTYFPDTENGLCLAGVTHFEDDPTPILCFWYKDGEAFMSAWGDLRMDTTTHHGWIIVDKHSGKPHPNRAIYTEDEAKTLARNAAAENWTAVEIKWEV